MGVVAAASNIFQTSGYAGQGRPALGTLAAVTRIAPTMSDSDYERAILWVPDPNSPAGWIRRKVWADEPKRKKPPMGFGFGSRRAAESSATDDRQRHGA